jgi:hypothetical protein
VELNLSAMEIIRLLGTLGVDETSSFLVDRIQLSGSFAGWQLDILAYRLYLEQIIGEPSLPKISVQTKTEK